MADGASPADLRLAAVGVVVGIEGRDHLARQLRVSYGKRRAPGSAARRAGAVVVRSRSDLRCPLGAACVATPRHLDPRPSTDAVRIPAVCIVTD
jgi:hypothetical protein